MVESRGDPKADSRAGLKAANWALRKAETKVEP